MIYKRFTEKSAEEWRQIYKALQLMEFLIKNGSERVIDDARSHLSLLKMLRQFHYIDQNGKDQGVNVRNRSKELTELLSDVDRIRAERKKARSTRNKYGGVEGGGGAGLGGSSSGRYGGFGSESGGFGAGYGGATRGVYGDGGGFGGETHEEYDETGRTSGADRFDEYDEYDDGGATAPTSRRKTQTRPATKTAEPAKPKEPEVDLFDFGDDDTTMPTSSANGTAASILAAPVSTISTGEDDDFDDFQSAGPSATTAAAQPAIGKPNYSNFAIASPTTVSATPIAQPIPQPGTQKADFSNLFNTTSPPPPAAAATTTTTSAFPPPASTQQAKASGYQPTGPNYFTSVQAGSPVQASTTGTSSSQLGGTTATKKPANGDVFASLLAGTGAKKSQGAQKSMTIADMAKQKSQAGLYGANATTTLPAATATPKPSTGSSGLDDLLG